MSFTQWLRVGSLVGVIIMLLVVRGAMKRSAAAGAAVPGTAPSARVTEKVPVYFPANAIPTQADLATVLKRRGFADIATMVNAATLPCWRLAPAVTGAVTREPVSRLGGRPELPDAGLWPAWRGRRLAFLCQLNLMTLAASRDATLSQLPHEGMLYFFYAVDQSPQGNPPTDRGSWRVLYSQAIPESGPVAWPEDLPATARFKEQPVVLIPSLSLPDGDDLVPEQNRYTEQQEEELYTIIGQYEGRFSPRHQLLGHPATLQGPMGLECYLASHGQEVKPGTRLPETPELVEGAAEWQLLLQLDSDEAVGMKWGDCGRLYFWITRSDLAKRQFENVWMIMQCF